MNLSQYDLKAASEKPQRMILKDPIKSKPMADDKGNEFYIECLGVESEAFKVKKFDFNRQTEKLRADKKELSYEMEKTFNESKSELFSELVTGWYLVDDGKPVEFSKDAAKKLFIQYDWIIKQLDVFIGDYSNFIKA